MSSYNLFNKIWMHQIICVITVSLLEEIFFTDKTFNIFYSKKLPPYFPEGSAALTSENILYI